MAIGPQKLDELSKEEVEVVASLEIELDRQIFGHQTMPAIDLWVSLLSYSRNIESGRVRKVAVQLELIRRYQKAGWSKVEFTFQETGYGWSVRFEA